MSNIGYRVFACRPACTIQYVYVDEEGRRKKVGGGSNVDIDEPGSIANRTALPHNARCV